MNDKTNCCATPNELAAQKAQLTSIPQTANQGSASPEDWKPLGEKPMAGYITK